MDFRRGWRLATNLLFFIGGGERAAWTRLQRQSYPIVLPSNLPPLPIHSANLHSVKLLLAAS